MAPQKKGSKTKSQREFMVDIDFKVNEKKRYVGEVVYFSRRGGFGFIKPDTDGLVPNDRLMMIWRELKSDDAWPYAHKGLKVEFNISKFVKANKSGAFLKATEISAPGGKKINLQVEAEKKKSFVHSKDTRFTGTVKWYNTAKGKGYVDLDNGYAGVDKVPKSLVVVRNEIHSVQGQAAVLRPDMKVEFGIQINERGFYTVYHLTLPGGKAINRLEVEKRKTVGSSSYSGHISFYNYKQGYGYIKPDNINKIPANVRSAMSNSTSEAKTRLEKRGKDKKASSLDSLLYFRRGDIADQGRAMRGQQADFHLYLDNRGAGAHEIRIA